MTSGFTVPGLEESQNSLCGAQSKQEILFRFKALRRTFGVKDWLFFYGTKVPFTLYSYENKVSVDSRQGWRLIWVGILLRLFVTRPNGCLTSLAKSETNLCGKGLSRRWPN